MPRAKNSATLESAPSSLPPTAADTNGPENSVHGVTAPTVEAQSAAAHDESPVLATDFCIGQATGVTLLDVLAIGLLQQNSTTFDHDHPVLRDRIRAAYLRAKVMLEVREEFI